MRTLKIAVYTFCLTTIAACSSSLSSKDVAQLALKSGACSSYETFFHDQVQTAFENKMKLPSPEDLKIELETEMKSLNYKENIKTELIENVIEFYTVIYEEVQKSEENEDILRDLVKLEYKTHEDESLQKTYESSLKSFTNLAQKEMPECTPPSYSEEEETPTEEPLPFYEDLKSKTNLAEFGAVKTFSVAYQSCTAHSQKPIDSPEESLSGVTRVGTHPAGGGVRVITNKNEVLRTHPYIVNNRVPASNECQDPTAKPKIYDFGGKPHTTSDANSTLNFFKDAGTGSNEFGVDCSGYVYSAFMSAGLKLSPNRPLRARGVLETPARAFKDFESYGMTCFNKVKTGVNSLPLQPGDVLASRGHIVIVNKVGTDPLGVESLIKNNRSCNDISYRDFNFTIFQSSPTNGAIGLNHMQASYYLQGSTSMRVSMEKFAKKHCSDLKNKSQSTPSISEATLIRHSMSPSCVEEKALKLDHESCLKRCS